MDIDTTTTKKYASFLSTPLRDVASLSQVPGVGTVTLGKLMTSGIKTPQQLVGQFMVLNKDTDSMIHWLRTACSVRSREADVIAEALLAKTERVGLM